MSFHTIPFYKISLTSIWLNQSLAEETLEVPNVYLLQYLVKKISRSIKTS